MIAVRRFLATILIFFVLLSSFSFNVNAHFCGDNLKSFSLFGSASKCGMATDNYSDFCSSTQSLDAEGCCTDFQVIVDGQEHQNDNNDSELQLRSTYILLLVASTLEITQTLPFEKMDQIMESPPNLQEDIQIQFQTFLI